MSIYKSTNVLRSTMQQQVKELILYYFMDVLIYVRYVVIIIFPICKTMFRAGQPGISFHRFPKEKKLRLQWTVAVKIGKKLPKNASVCSLHFQKTDFIGKYYTCIQE